MCRGALVCFGGLCSLLEHGFVLDVSSCCPCLRVRDLSSSSDPFLGFRSLVGVSFIFSFSLITQCVYSQCTHQGRD
jgi:hypothetical protein